MRHKNNFLKSVIYCILIISAFFTNTLYGQDMVVIGSSFTTDIGEYCQSMLAQKGITVTNKKCQIIGASIEFIWNNDASSSPYNPKTELQSGNNELLFMNAQVPWLRTEMEADYSGRFAQLGINSYPGLRTMIQDYWVTEPAQYCFNQGCGNYDNLAMYRRGSVKVALLMTQTLNKQVYIAPVGLTIEKVKELAESGQLSGFTRSADLFDTDGKHLGPLGKYVQALTILCGLHQKDVRGYPSTVYSPYGGLLFQCSTTDAAKIQDLIYSTVRSTSFSGWYQDESSTVASYITSLKSNLLNFESFDKCNASTGSLGNGNYVGDNNITWNYIKAKLKDDHYSLTDKCIELGAGGELSATIAGGVGNLSVHYRLGEGYSTNLKLYVNNVLKYQVDLVGNKDSKGYTFADINTSGSVSVRLVSSGTYVQIDNVVWSSYGNSTDNLAPTAPTNLTNGTITTNSVELSWSASTDNVGVTAYNIYTNGSYVTSVASTSTTLTGLTSSTSYAIMVKARDAAGNLSASSNTINIQTLAGDGEAPTAPSGLAATEITSTGCKLSWGASTDNVGVVAYDIFQTGTFKASTTGTNYYVTGLTPSTQYDFTVKARDAANNVSATSNSALFTTLSASLRSPENPSNTTNGLDYQQYNGSWNALPDFNSLAPASSGTFGTFSVASKAGTDLFAFRFTGFIDVPSDGNYTFFTKSDDGSKLYIGTTEVVNNDGLHGELEKSGTIGLKAGKHAITVTMFEKTGGEILVVSYSGPGITKQVVPSAVLFRISQVVNLEITGLNPPTYAVSTYQLGGAVYTDRSYTFTQVPAELAGKKMIKTANNDKINNSSTYISFTVNKPVTMYLAIDNRITNLPTWYSTWVKTSLTTSINDNNPSGYSFYRKDFAAGMVVLGGCNTTSYSNIIPVISDSQVAPVIGLDEEVNSITTADMEQTITVFPNPIKKQGTLSIFNPSAVETNIRLVDMNGRVVVARSIKQGVTTIDLINCLPGIYLFQELYPNKCREVKVIVE